MLKVFVLPCCRVRSALVYRYNLSTSKKEKAKPFAETLPT